MLRKKSALRFISSPLKLPSHSPKWGPINSMNTNIRQSSSRQKDLSHRRPKCKRDQPAGTLRRTQLRLPTRASLDEEINRQTRVNTSFGITRIIHIRWYRLSHHWNSILPRKVWLLRPMLVAQLQTCWSERIWTSPPPTTHMKTSKYSNLRISRSSWTNCKMSTAATSTTKSLRSSSKSIYASTSKSRNSSLGQKQ